MNERTAEMVSLCIIDDIKSVVEGLSALNWMERGVRLAGTAANGEEGLKLVRRVKPDIILTDIRMPRMDGLEMLRSELELKHMCRVILISGYADFDYAKQAVKLGAFDFVVKPFTEEEITAVVDKAKEQIMLERSRLLNEETMERKLRESIPLLRQEYMALLAIHPTPWERAAGRWEFLGMDLAPEHLAVLMLDIDGFEAQNDLLSVHEIELIRFTLQNVVEETLRADTRCIIFRLRQGRFIAIVNAVRTAEAMQWAERCRLNIRDNTRFTVSIGVGGIAERLEVLPESYRQAEWALMHHLYTGGDGVIGYGEIPQSGKPMPRTLEHKDELLLALQSGNGEKAGELLREMAGALRKGEDRPSPDYLISLYEELAASAMRTFYERIPLPDIQPLAARFKAMRGSSAPTLQGLQQQLEQLCRQGAELVKANALSEGQALIYKALDFLNGRLDREVTVAETAAQVHLSPSYFSSLFKKVTGATLTQYVAAERIRKAKAMLAEGVPVQEVAASVGYEERRYFSDMFKRLTGMTPSEFRDSL